MSEYANILPEILADSIQCLNKSGNAWEVQIANRGGKRKFPGFSQNFKFSTKAYAWTFGMLK